MSTLDQNPIRNPICTRCATGELVLLSALDGMNRMKLFAVQLVTEAPQFG